MNNLQKRHRLLPIITAALVICMTIIIAIFFVNNFITNNFSFFTDFFTGMDALICGICTAAALLFRQKRLMYVLPIGLSIFMCVFSSFVFVSSSASWLLIYLALFSIHTVPFYYVFADKIKFIRRHRKGANIIHLVLTALILIFDLCMLSLLLCSLSDPTYYVNPYENKLEAIYMTVTGILYLADYALLSFMLTDERYFER